MFLREDFRLEPASCYVDAKCPRYKAVIPSEEDLTPLMPYINATAKVLFYEPKEPVIVFKMSKHKVALRRFEAQIADVKDIPEGKKLLAELDQLLKEIWLKKEEITPLFEPKEKPTALEIYKYLPKTNCGLCGEATCLAFASKLSMGDVDLLQCKPLFEDQKYKDLCQKLENLI
ncbi:(Fe-S)-binding protein [Thermodesulfatator autotrophicus]|uniref:4Fe-4S domain-containing protein n=1 Tax=Thermodesulfatator autotrophicus TaxID=1795632 RepID=A0A177E722_9BACT|nr:(Fe-S)-binding protein [Thermodesulfatator autotrophicus]OAG27744.1 hypothetical protein TH606_05155 [Thermodesulfatator autotrophicus]